MTTNAPSPRPGRLIPALAIALAAFIAAPASAAGPDHFRDCPSCPEMVPAPGRAIAVAERETTRAQFAAFIGASQYQVGIDCRTLEDGAWAIRSPRDFRSPGLAQKDDDPALCLTWYDARAYVSWLNAQAGGGSAYRLPSAAEWRALEPEAPRLGLVGFDSGAAEWTADCASMSSHPPRTCVLRQRLGRHWASERAPGGPLPTAAPTDRNAATGFRVVKDLAPRPTEPESPPR